MFDTNICYENMRKMNEFGQSCLEIREFSVSYYLREVYAPYKKINTGTKILRVIDKQTKTESQININFCSIRIKNISFFRFIKINMK